MDDWPTLLVVEDEPIIRTSLAEALQEAGFNTIESCTGEQAVSRLRAATVAAVVTDIRLGAGMNGWEVARCARQLQAHVAVIYITGDSASDWLAEGVPKSIIVQKPFVAAQMVTAVLDLLAR